MDRRFFLIGALALAGCASQPALPTAPTRPVTLDQAFVGHKRGTGLFRVSLTGAERRFAALLNGRLSQGGQRLTVVEDFTYDDGQKNRLTWVFDRTSPTTWAGRRDDTVGIATVTEGNGIVRLTYTADFASATRVTRLGFADVIYLRDDGVIVNDAVVTRAGFPVGTVRFEIRRDR